MNSIMLRLRSFFQWSVCALVLMGTVANSSALSVDENLDLNNSTGEMPARLVPLPPEQTRIHEGMLDVTKAPYFADNTGTTDARQAIQNAIDDAYLSSLVVYFPSGTYLCSDILSCYQTNIAGKRGQMRFAHKLVGSTLGPRPVIKLMDGANLSYLNVSGNPVANPIFIHYNWRGNFGGAFEEHGEVNYGGVFRGIDIDMGNNPTAVALNMTGAQHCVIEDAHIYGTDFFLGVVTPGGGGSVANLKVTGGQNGVKTGRNVPNVTGLTLENQSRRALETAQVGPAVIAGFSIKGPASPATDYRAVYLRNTQTGVNGAWENLIMVDGTIEVPGSSGVAIDNYDQDVYLQNVYVKADTIISSGSRYAPTDTLAGNASSWMQIRRYAFRSQSDNAMMMVDGVSLGTPNTDHEFYEPLLPVAAPPTNLMDRHLWNEADFPAWDDPDRVSITDFGAIPENGEE